MPNIALDFTSTYTLVAVNEQRKPEHFFIRDRYFPTGANDIFHSDKVITEFRNQSLKMAPFVAPRVGDISVERRGYAVHDYQPPYIGLRRSLTLDELTKRGFGEALYANSTAAARAKALLSEDMDDLDRRISRRENWMCMQVMLTNGCTCVEYSDNGEQGDSLILQYYDSTSDHTYTVNSSYRWDTANGNPIGDVHAMCRNLARRGLPATDLLLGSKAADAFLANSEIRELLNKNSGIRIGDKLEYTFEEYPGVSYLGKLNFGGFILNIFVIEEIYEADDGTPTEYFPAEGAIVTAPGCGHLMYAQITQIPFGGKDFETFAEKRVPKLIVDTNKDYRAIRLASRPLAAPKDYCPYIYAANVVS